MNFKKISIGEKACLHFLPVFKQKNPTPWQLVGQLAVIRWPFCTDDACSVMNSDGGDQVLCVFCFVGVGPVPRQRGGERDDHFQNTGGESAYLPVHVQQCVRHIESGHSCRNVWIGRLQGALDYQQDGHQRGTYGEWSMTGGKPGLSGDRWNETDDKLYQGKWSLTLIQLSVTDLE